VFTDDTDGIGIGLRDGSWQSALGGKKIIHLDQFETVPVSGYTF
jgi:hypothetical protein